jgi:RNA-directed DNA polymerase
MREVGAGKRAEKSARVSVGSDGIADGRCDERQTCTARGDEAADGAPRLMEEVLRRENLLRAYKRVMRNKGGPGADGMTVEELGPYCVENWDRLREELRDGNYRPSPVRVVRIRKPDGNGYRMLGIPTVLDRMIQQALLQELTPVFDPGFSEDSYGFRPGRGPHDAVKRAKEHVDSGNDWVVDVDLEKFFDLVNHDVLMARVARKVKDKDVLRLIRRYLQAGLMEGGMFFERSEGTPQGGPLSPLLSNILLDDLDKELERRGHRFCRYADDFNVYVKSETAGERVMASLEQFLGKRLRLKVNRGKSAVGRPWDRKFLGYSFTNEAKPRLKVSPKSEKRLRKKLKPLWKKGRGTSLKTSIQELNQTLVGWASYYRLAEVLGAFKVLDHWIRHRLRCIIWRQWKRPGTRAKKLIQLGVNPRRAKATAWAMRGPWPSSMTQAMHYAIPTKALEEQGLKSLVCEYRRFTCSV